MEKNIFNRNLLRMRRNRYASLFAQHNFIRLRAAENIVQFLESVKGDFPNVLDLNTSTGELIELFPSRCNIENIVCCDISEEMLRHNICAGRHDVLMVCADEEELPFSSNSFNLVTSCMGLHNVNDLLSCMRDIYSLLREEGLFIAVMPAPATLRELREALDRATIDIEGGVCPRVSPFVDIQDAGDLLYRAGFRAPIVDSEKITISYSDMFSLMRDIRGAGEANIMFARRKTVSRREVFTRAAEIYRDRFSDGKGNVTATVELLTLIGWK